MDSGHLAESQRGVFEDLSADDAPPDITEIESFCICCKDQGVTRLLLTRIPFYREVIIASFTCSKCGYRNADLQPAADIQDEGCRYTISVTGKQGLNRQVVMSRSAAVSVPSLELEIPVRNGALTTVEGVVTKVIEDLERQQSVRKIQHPDLGQQIDEFLGKLRKLLTLEFPFDMVLDDPAGNSFVENPLAPCADPALAVTFYTRSPQQDRDLGIIQTHDSGVLEESEEEIGCEGEAEGPFDASKEVLKLGDRCPHCGVPCETNMKLVEIPHFKEVVLMATNCERCGYRDNAVVTGGGTEKTGTRITLTINGREDMSRDLLKSTTSHLQIPELEFETEMGTLGGRFTTVEGILQNIKDSLVGNNPFVCGDSCYRSAKDRIAQFTRKIDQIITGEMPGVHLILDDPAGNSYIQSLTAPPAPDPQLEVEVYERTWSENEELGLNDMRTENYEDPKECR